MGVAGRCADEPPRHLSSPSPRIGFLVTLLIPRAQEQAIRDVHAGCLARRPSCFRSASPSAIRPARPASSSSPTSIWIANPGDPLARRHRRPEPLADHSFHVPDADRHPDLLALHHKTASKEFFAFLLLLEFGLVGVFAAWDLFLFYVFWEVVLVPMYFLIGIWGHDRRIYAAVKFFLYTMAGSVLMLVGDHLPVQSRGHVRLRRDSRAVRQRQDRAHPHARKRCCSSLSSSPSPSKCRSSRCTPGCPTRTWKRPRPVR